MALWLLNNWTFEKYSSHISLLITIVREISIKPNVELEGKNNPEPSHVKILPNTILATSNEGKRNKIHAMFTKRNVTNIRTVSVFGIKEDWHISLWGQYPISFLYTVISHASPPKNKSPICTMPYSTN